MKCSICDKSGFLRTDLMLSQVLCDEHYSHLKKAEENSSQYFRVRDRIKNTGKNIIGRIEKARIRYATRLMIESGAIEKKACSVCEDSNSQVHHFDYNDPENIDFLCEKHHREWHRNNEAISTINTISTV